jgi:hypothetical protein
VIEQIISSHTGVEEDEFIPTCNRSARPKQVDAMIVSNCDAGKLAFHHSKN